MEEPRSIVPATPQRGITRGTQIPDECGRTDLKRSPAEQMRLMLAASKRSGVPFDRAWAMAWENIAWPHNTEERRDWRFILGLVRPVWRDGFEGRDPGERMRLIAAMETFGMVEVQAA